MNVTEGVPCMITSNDDLITVIRAQNKKFGDASVDAALRRLYLIPMKMPNFEKLHYSQIPVHSSSKTKIGAVSNRL